MVRNSIDLLSLMYLLFGKMLKFIIEVAEPVSIKQFSLLFSMVRVAMGNAGLEDPAENFL